MKDQEINLEHLQVELFYVGNCVQDVKGLQKSYLEDLQLNIADKVATNEVVCNTVVR